jgi:hypothetical protein
MHLIGVINQTLTKVKKDKEPMGEVENVHTKCVKLLENSLVVKLFYPDSNYSSI